jgi:hypothetical protein
MMKKQILPRCLLLLAVFAGSSVFGQNMSAVKGSNPRGFSCNDDALHPIAGKTYTYEISATPASGSSVDVQWWATKATSFIKTDGTLNTTGALVSPDIVSGTNYNVLTTDQKTMQITWSDNIIANTSYRGKPSTGTPTFVAAYVEDGCTNNIKVFQIDPINAFTVDILNYDGTTALTWDKKDDQCIDDVSSAIYNMTSYEMEYKYGVNVFVYEVIAANFTSSYTPYFNLSGLNAKQTYDLQWTYDAPASWGSTTVWNDIVTGKSGDLSTTSGGTVSSKLTDTSGGVSIYVRLTVTNNNFENNVTDNPIGIDITLSVDGQNSASVWDIDNWDEANGTTACVQTSNADLEDKAIQTLLPRPAIKEGTSSTTTPNIGLIPDNSVN